MHTTTRFPLERYAAIDRAIRAGTYPNANKIARELEVCPRTIQRDIERLRNHHGAPIEYVAKEHGYAYSNPDFTLSSLHLTTGELFAIFLAERVLQQYRGTPYAETLADVFSRLTAGLDESITVDLSHLGQLQSFRTTAAVEIKPQLFQTLATAIRERHRLRLRYYSASRNQESTRLVDPYHLASVDGQWYLIGFCHLREAVRMFVPNRMKSAKNTGIQFERPTDFRAEDYLSSAFAVIRGDGVTQRVRLRFTGEAVKYIRERVWHSSQQIAEPRRGELILTLEVSHLREVERFALSWMPECEVLEPNELRELVARALTQAAKINMVNRAGNVRRSRRVNK